MNLDGLVLELVDSGVLAVICYLLITRVEKRLDRIIELLKNA